MMPPSEAWVAGADWNTPRHGRDAFGQAGCSTAWIQQYHRGRVSERRLPSIVLLLAVIVAAVVAACSGDEPRAGIYVQPSWHVARAVTGHRVHVLQKGVACRSCHALTGDELGKVEPARCASCHEKEGRIEHAAQQASARLGAGTKADCTSCHAFTLDATGHEDQLRALDQPRSSGGAGGMHGGRGEPPLLSPFGPGDCKRCHAVAQGDIPAVEVHGSQDCLSCHKPHDDRTPKSAPCSDCHQDITTAHASQGKDVTQICSTCHTHQHAAAVDARKGCVECHRTTRPLVPASALFEGGHTECVGCHRPHAFGGQQAVDCRTCHADQNVLGGSQVSAHQRCTNCHAPHDVKAGPERACVSCHADVHPDHPELSRQGGCVGCHDAHPRGSHAKDAARSCSSCHQFAASDHAAHGGTACTQCHKPHDFAIELVGAAACRDCHAQRVQQVSTNAGHQDCQGCHHGLPHRPEALLTGCGSCHAKQQAAVPQGHARCQSCHEPHSGTLAAACSSCHASEHASAPVGHQTCTNCHEPHSGNHTVKACASCHAPEAGSAHGKLASGCATCHRPHGPEGVAKPPACSSCHQPSALPGLHQEAKHQACQGCHTGHGDAPGLERQICLSCHRDRTAHFPDAPRCANCHLFTPNH
jgi:hypothetical protein